MCRTPDSTPPQLPDFANALNASAQAWSTSAFVEPSR